jgi:hypothetical protein
MDRETMITAADREAAARPAARAVDSGRAHSRRSAPPATMRVSWGARRDAEQHFGCEDECECEQHVDGR